jgi:hypothetical protein
MVEDKETTCADDLWAYIEAHKDEVEDLEEYARKRGLKTTAQNALSKIYLFLIPSHEQNGMRQFWR